MGNTFAPLRKEWIVSAIGAGVGLASSLFGGMSAASAAREAERRQREQEARENADYTRRRYEDYVDTAAGQNLVRMAKEHYRQGVKRAQGAKAVAGGTDAATAIAKEQGNKMVGDTIANIAAQDTARKDRADELHSQAQERFAQMDMAREQQRAQSITNAAQNASNAIMSAAGAVEQASAKTTNLQGGSNNSKNVTQMDSEVGKFGATDPDKVVHFDGNGTLPAGDYTSEQLAKYGF